MYKKCVVGGVVFLLSYTNTVIHLAFLRTF